MSFAKVLEVDAVLADDVIGPVFKGRTDILLGFDESSILLLTFDQLQGGLFLRHL